jgi:hypothetical protein
MTLTQTSKPRLISTPKLMLSGKLQPIFAIFEGIG